MRRYVSENLQMKTTSRNNFTFDNLGHLNTLVVNHKRELKAKLRSHFDANNKTVCPRFNQEKKLPKLKGLIHIKDFKYILLKLKNTPKFMSMITKNKPISQNLSKIEIDNLSNFLAECSFSDINLVFLLVSRRSELFFRFR
jgi:hypothetical protein